MLEQDKITLKDLSPWPLILSGPESLTRQLVEQELRNQGVSCDVVLALNDTGSIKRYVETGMGVAVCADFTLHQQDHDRLGVVRLDHIYQPSLIGVCTLKGKFLGQAVRNFIEVLSDEMRGFHADLAGITSRPVKSGRQRPGSSQSPALSGPVPPNYAKRSVPPPCPFLSHPARPCVTLGRATATDIHFGFGHCRPSHKRLA